MLNYDPRTFRELADDVQMLARRIATWSFLGGLAVGIAAAIPIVLIKPDLGPVGLAVAAVGAAMGAGRGRARTAEMRLRVGSALCLAAIEENMRAIAKGAQRP